MCLHLLYYFIFLFQIDLCFLCVRFFPLSQQLSHLGSAHIQVEITAGFAQLTRWTAKTGTAFAGRRRVWYRCVCITDTTRRTSCLYGFRLIVLRTIFALWGRTSRRRVGSVFLIINKSKIQLYFSIIMCENGIYF